nr:putative nucleotidyltransferase, ribonuclease H [Tanacetum cinerariifolium]
MIAVIKASLRVEPNLISRIKEAQKEDIEIWTIVENLDKQVEFHLDDDNVLWQGTRLVVPNDASLREALLTEAHSSPFSIHPGSTKIKSRLSTSGLVTQRRHDAIWVIVDRLTKSAHFLPIRKDYSVSRLAKIFQQEIVRLHGTSSAIVSDRDPRFASHFWKGLQKAWGTRLKFSTAFHPQIGGQSEHTIQTLKDMLRSCALEWTCNLDDYICLVEFAYNNSWHASIKCAPFEMLYGRKCRAPICWDQVSERVIEGSEMIEVTNAKVVVAKEKLKEAHTRQKSYADKHRTSLEFQPGDHVFLKVSPARGVRCFGIKGKLSPRFIGPFEILDRVGEVSYRLALPPQLSHVHNVFHVSLLRGYKYHPLHVISYPLDQTHTDLSYVEEPEAILDRQDRVMRKKTIPFIKVGEHVIEGPEMIKVTNEKVAPGDRVFLKVSPARGVRRFGIKGKLSPRFIRPFEILDRVGEVLYRLALPPPLTHVHNVFHVSLLRGYMYHPLHVISYPLDQIRADLSYVKEPEAILNRQDRVMRKKTIPFVKILWRNHPEREATWETEESIWTSYPHFLP